MKNLWISPLAGKASDLPVEGFVMIDKDMREWAQARGMHVFYSGLWHVMIGRVWCTPGYDTPQKALEACWESGEYEDLAKCASKAIANQAVEVAGETDLTTEGEMPMTCQHCKYWERLYPKAPYFRCENIIVRDMLNYDDLSVFVTPADFGCNKFEVKE